MFDSMKINKKLQCSSEFNLYRCDNEDNYYTAKKKKTVFEFTYLIVLLTSVIVLTAISLVTYNYIAENNPIIKINASASAIEINELENCTESTTIDSLDYPEPIALELQTNRRKSEDPRPFIYEIRDPRPIGFHFNNKQQQTHQNSPAKNIQEIIKLLEQSNQDNRQDSNKNVRYKKRNQGRRRDNRLSYLADPFFPYKPQNPSDINLLATNNFRFAPAVQIFKNPTTIPTTTEQYPKYERPHYYQQDFTDYNQQIINKRVKTRKPLNNQNLYYQNNYFTPSNRFQQNRAQPNWNLPYWNNEQYNQRNNYEPILRNRTPMIVHLNLYPKKRRKQIESDTGTEESNFQTNCTEQNFDHKLDQIKNTTEFNQLLEQIRHKNNLYRVKNTFLELNKHEINSNDYDKFNSQPNIDVQKSIGFTVVNPNFSLNNDNEYESQWKPISVPLDHQFVDITQKNHHDEYYDLEVGEANDNYERNEEPVTLPIPLDVFQKYFNRRPTPKYNNDWDPDIIQENPNLVNHNSKFPEDRDE